MIENCVEFDEGDTIRILVTSDNHLGFAETDSVRKNDCFESFEEALLIGKRENVDLAVFGGDLFHENRPSRYTMYKTIDILRRYCFSGEASNGGVRILPHPEFALNPTWKGFNFQDPSFRVDLPIFSIHGNHDEPTGEDFLSALDILHNGKILNYFGKFDLVENLRCLPVQVYRGRTRVAIYGIGNIRNERLSNLLKSGKLTFVAPHEFGEEEIFGGDGSTGGNVEARGDLAHFEDGDRRYMRGNRYIKLLLLHQDRNQYSPRSCVLETLIEGFDLVIWGHEHECRIEPIAFGSLHISQPGSTVVTSLCESEEVAKKVAILEVNGGHFRMIPHKLEKIRPFVFKSYSLSALMCNRGYFNDFEMQSVILEVLSSKIDEILAQIPSERLPLIRVKVDYTGYGIISRIRFGQRFVNRVANPEGILLFHKPRRFLGHKANCNGPGSTENDVEEMLENPESNITELIDMYLKEANTQCMSFLSAKKMAKIVHRYVQNGDERLISMFIDYQLNSVQRELMNVEFSEFEKVMEGIKGQDLLEDENADVFEYGATKASKSQQGVASSHGGTLERRIFMDDENAFFGLESRENFQGGSGKSITAPLATKPARQRSKSNAIQAKKKRSKFNENGNDHATASVDFDAMFPEISIKKEEIDVDMPFCGNENFNVNGPIKCRGLGPKSLANPLHLEKAENLALGTSISMWKIQ